MRVWKCVTDSDGRNGATKPICRGATMRKTTLLRRIAPSEPVQSRHNIFYVRSSVNAGGTLYHLLAGDGFTFRHGSDPRPDP